MSELGASLSIWGSRNAWKILVILVLGLPRLMIVLGCLDVRFRR